jgi:ABC-type Na+ efflux pump permease subunit
MAIILLIAAFLLWAGCIRCLTGTEVILISGVGTLPRAERQKYRERHDMKAMNKDIGKRVLLPLSVALSLAAPLVYLNAPWMRSAWFGAAVAAVSLAVMGYVAYGAVKVLGGDYVRK